MTHELNHTIRKFDRFELKYVITLKEAERFKGALQAFMIPDEHGGNSGRYELASLYYDSPDLRCYREKMDGLKFRRKLRIRRYETGEMMTEESPVFVEIKQRVDRVTQKRRALLSYGEALRLCNDRQIPEHDASARALIEEVYVFLWQYNLVPASIVRYERQALIGTEYDVGLRVTFDTSLTAQAHPTHLHETPAGLSILPAYWVVMEIKVNERIPTWLTDLIAAHGLHMTRISKYCRSIHAIGDQPAIRRRVPVAESSQEVLSSAYSEFSRLEEKIGIRE